MTVRSDKLRRFEYSTRVTSVAKQTQRTELQRDIDAWLAAGNRIQEAAPLVVQPRRSRREPTPEASKPFRQRAPWSDAEVEYVRQLKAQGLTHAQAAKRISEMCGVERGRQAVESLCHLRGIPSVFVKRPKREAKA